MSTDDMNMKDEVHADLQPAKKAPRKSRRAEPVPAVGDRTDSARRLDEAGLDPATAPALTPTPRDQAAAAGDVNQEIQNEVGEMQSEGDVTAEVSDVAPNANTQPEDIPEDTDVPNDADTGPTQAPGPVQQTPAYPSTDSQIPPSKDAPAVPVDQTVTDTSEDADPHAENVENQQSTDGPPEPEPPTSKPDPVDFENVESNVAETTKDLDENGNPVNPESLNEPFTAVAEAAADEAKANLKVRKEAGPVDAGTSYNDPKPVLSDYGKELRKVVKEMDGEIVNADDNVVMFRATLPAEMGGLPERSLVWGLDDHGVEIPGNLGEYGPPEINPNAIAASRTYSPGPLGEDVTVNENTPAVAISEKDWTSSAENHGTVIIDRPEEWRTQDYLQKPPQRVRFEHPIDAI